MFISIVLNAEYMDIASRTKWYLKNLLHCKQNGWILITHEYMRIHFDELQKEVTKSLFDSWEMEPFELQDLNDVEQYFVPDELFDDLEKYYGSRSEMLFALNSPVETVLDECMSGIFERIKQKHPQEEINGIFNSLESFECVRSISRKWNIPLFNYSFSAIRKPHGYRQTLYHVNRDRFWTAEECESRWHKFEKELKDSHVPIFTNQEIIAIIGKERTLPLLQLMDSSPKYEMGVCCECYALLPQVFEEHPYTDDDIFYECKKIYGKEKMKVRSHSLHLDEIQVDRSEVRNDPAAFLLSCKRLAAVQSQILLKALLWKRTAVMKKDTLAFSFLCAKEVDMISHGNLEGLNYYIFGYLIPAELMFSDKYWQWRLTNPSELEIYQCHLDYLLSSHHIEKEKILSLSGKQRLTYLLATRGCDKQLITALTDVHPVVEQVNWDVASSRFDVYVGNKSKTYWRIDRENADKSLSTHLVVDVENATKVEFYPLDDVAGFAKLNTVMINGKELKLDIQMTEYQYMQKDKGCFVICFNRPINGLLNLECVWSYKKISDYLNN